MPASMKNILIGVFVLVAISIIVFMLLFLHPSVGDNAKTLHVRFTDIDKVNLGTRVTYAGRPVGEVVAIEEIPEARTSRISRYGDVYVYELTLKVDSGVDVFNTDEILLRTSGLLGERNVEINPRPVKPHEKLKHIENEVIYATQTGSVEGAMKNFEVLSDKFGVVLDDFHNFMQEVKAHKIVDKASDSLQNVFDITQSLNQPEKWKQTLDNIVRLSERANHSWTTVDSSLQNIYSLTDRAHRTWTTIDHSINNFHDVSVSAKRSWPRVDQALQEFYAAGTGARDFTNKANLLIENTQRGEGTLGQLFVGNDLYLRLKSVLHKGSVIMDDMSHYGILFHLDKRWQRLQGQRLRLMEKLSSPCEFARFFNQEMDEISSSISRVTMLLNESDGCSDSLIFNPAFIQRFADLLKKVENMEETLQLYNQQIVDQDMP